MIIDCVSADGKYGLSLGEEVVDRLRRLCVASEDRETGGVLAGHYDSSHQLAVVTRASGPPAGSQRGRTSFVRTVGGLQRWLDQMWSRRSAYYLGEWHFHPGGTPTPSGTDRAQMWEIADDSKYACPEPILLIVGGDPRAGLTWSATVFLRGGSAVRLGDQGAPTSVRPRSRLGRYAGRAR